MTNEDIDKLVGITPAGDTFESLFSFIKDIKLHMGPELTPSFCLILNTIETTLIAIEPISKRKQEILNRHLENSQLETNSLKQTLKDVLPLLDSLSTTVELVIAGMKAKVGWEIGDDHD